MRNENLEAMKIEDDFPPESLNKNEIESNNAEDEEDNAPLYIYNDNTRKKRQIGKYEDNCQPSILDFFKKMKEIKWI